MYQLLTAASISIGAWLVVDIFVLYMIYDMHIILIIIYVYVYIYIYIYILYLYMHNFMSQNVPKHAGHAKTG